MKSETQDYLLKIEDLLRAINPLVLANYNTGLSKSVIAEKVKHTNLEFSDELFLLYEWRNGLNLKKIADNTIVSTMFIVPLGYQCSLDNAIKIRNINTEGMDVWSKGYFPIFKSGGGDYYMVDLEKNSATFGAVFVDSPGYILAGGIVPAFDSLTSFVKTIYESYKEEIFFFDDMGRFDWKDREYVLLARSINPNSQLWKEFEY